MNLEPGSIVTAADAPEGSPTWVGEVVDRPMASLRDSHMNGRVFVRPLGNVATSGVFVYFGGVLFRLSWRDDPDIRPLTDPEAVGLADMLTGYGYERLWFRTADMDWQAYQARALIAYTIGGKP